MQEWIDEATFSFTMGEHDDALALLEKALGRDAEAVAAWHAKAEILFDLRRLDEALVAAEAARQRADDDVHIHTTLSRIWMEKGDKAQAEHHGARARMLGWKAELAESPDEE